MARDKDLRVHLPQEVWRDINQSNDSQERRELEAQRYGHTPTWQAQEVLRLALRQYLREYTDEKVTPDTEIEPLPSGEIEITQPSGDSRSLNPFVN